MYAGHEGDAEVHEHLDEALTSRSARGGSSELIGVGDEPCSSVALH